ncbi:hypothetical protein Ple7327_3202 [Pleurocapsa sp. PCC 7327]|uniref:hypothetical protein n=1 Tax=Pleurocapsa sp. PCC 7327 TaxID=118163 RepID=UPI00029F9244|nr:hypothetical protein [Pleurocapsa sp. PCC 7327]AFY78428.1 hypothetical protein Ple7327_3202 [Pleurocapsa sp. PCC 7327]
MNLPEKKLQELLEAVESVNPQMVNYWQTTAIIESLGYTDRVIQKEFNFPNALSLGKYIYERHSPSPSRQPLPARQRFWKRASAEIGIFIEQFSRSFVYAIPLILTLLLEYIGLEGKGRSLPLGLASLITLATLASLCTSGGFVQMISRRGAFYIGLGEPLQARRVCLPIFYLGAAASILLCLVGLWFGFYRSLVADEYLILAAIYYLLLSLLWMLIAMLSVLFSKAEAFVLLGFSLLFLLLRVRLGMDAIAAQIATTSIALAAASVLVAIAFNKGKHACDGSAEVKLPHLSALIYLLAPYFFYGIGYFSFIFADRLIAGWAIDPASGLIFAINSDYQRDMDLALLNFLMLVPWVEYLSYKFIRYWYDRAKQLTLITSRAFVKKLRYLYGLAILLTVLFFIFSFTIVIGGFNPLNLGAKETSQTLLGCFGYLFFAIGLFNGILLFSLNRAKEALQALLPALALNFTVGYLCANLVDVYSAAIGLLVGAFAFMIFSSLKVLQAIKFPDYAYYLSGY